MLDIMAALEIAEARLELLRLRTEDKVKGSRDNKDLFIHKCNEKTIYT